MQDDFNPYAAPTASTMHPRAAEWLRSTDDPSLQKVARGLGLMYTGIILFIVTIILGLIFVTLFTAVASGLGFILSITIAGLVGLAALVMMIAGKLMCLATPEETGAKNLIVASIGLDIVGFVISLVGGLTGYGGVSLFGNLLTFVAEITFLLFLRQLSEFIGETPLVERARLLLTLLGTTVALNFLPLLGAFITIPLPGLLRFAAGIISIVSFFLYLGLLNRLRNAIQHGGAYA